MVRELPLILQLDAAGNPHKWCTVEKSAYYYAKGLIAWEAAPVDLTLYGGISRMTGEQSTLTMNTIIAIKGKINSKQLARINHVPLTNVSLFRRDKNICAYCGNDFHAGELSRDHIVPSSKGGPNIWTNVVTACHGCNKHKNDRTPEQSGMRLLYIPYAPCRSEYLILQNRKILSDQMTFLVQHLPKGSRVL